MKHSRDGRNSFYNTFQVHVKKKNVEIAEKCRIAVIDSLWSKLVYVENWHDFSQSRWPLSKSECASILFLKAGCRLLSGISFSIPEMGESQLLIFVWSTRRVCSKPAEGEFPQAYQTLRMSEPSGVRSDGDVAVADWWGPDRGGCVDPVGDVGGLSTWGQAQLSYKLVGFLLNSITH